MGRDPLSIALREATLKDDCWPRCLEQCAARILSICKQAQICSEIMGVVLVSYEKLITCPKSVVQRLNEWYGWDHIDPDATDLAIEPNNYHYLSAQTRGVIIRDAKE